MKKLIWILIVVILIGGFVWLVRTPGKPGRLDQFANCINDSGVLFYGAFWCPNCQNQKAAFGSSAKLLPYVECSTPDGNSQTPLCREKGIENYPTWVFRDGTVRTGELELGELSELTSCELPQS